MTITDPEISTAELRAHPLFAHLTDDQYAWLREVSTPRILSDGEVLFAENTHARFFAVLLDGELLITKMVDGREEVLTRHSTRSAESHDDKPSVAHTFTGELPMLADDVYIATATSVGISRVVTYDKETFMQMLVHAPAVCQVMLPVLAWRIQTQAAQAGQRNAINALGTLAAGIAHEINNPVAAMTRATSELDETMPLLRRYAEAWGKVATSEESEILETARQSWQDRTPGRGRYNALEAAQREDDIQDWLEDHDLDDGSMLAELLSERDLDDEWLEELADQLRPEVLVPALDYLTQSLSIQSHLTEIQEAERRVSGIVRDTKDYTNMDRAPEQDIDVRQGLEATVTMLQGRLGQITVTRDYAEHPPLIMAYPGELNQVWTNLIDNAIAAMEGKGDLHLMVRVEGGCVLVEIGDNGPGVPDSVLPHIFEPFFTTKDLGQGTGLGLHLSHRIITQRHSGSITVRSAPGNTRFQVRLPINAQEGVACAMPKAPTAQETS